MSIGLSDTIVPLGAFPITRDTDGYGGYRVCANHIERDNIVSTMRKPGMLVKTLNDLIIWELGSDLITWSPLSTSGGGLPPVNCVALANIALTGTNFTASNFDGTTVADGYRILLPFQTNSAKNGIYIKTGANLVLSTDVIGFGSNVSVIAGDYYGGDSFIQTGTTTWVAKSGPSYVAPITTLAAGGGSWTDWLTVPCTSLTTYIIDISITASAYNTNNNTFVSREVRSALFQGGSTLTVIDYFDFITTPDSPALFRMKPLTSNSSVIIQVFQDPSINYSYRVSSDINITRVG